MGDQIVTLKKLPLESLDLCHGPANHAAMIKLEHKVACALMNEFTWEHKPGSTVRYLYFGNRLVGTLTNCSTDVMAVQFEHVAAKMPKLFEDKVKAKPSPKKKAKPSS
jgi:hypothetical protein